MLEFLVEVVGELLIQLAGEILAELGVRSLAASFTPRANRWLAGIAYAMLGLVAGAISLWPFPAHLMSSETFRVLNLILTPVLVGLLMCLVGAWRTRRGQVVLRIDRFACGYLFALSFALVRFWFAT